MHDELNVRSFEHVRVMGKLMFLDRNENKLLGAQRRHKGSFYLRLEYMLLRVIKRVFLNYVRKIKKSVKIEEELSNQKKGERVGFSSIYVQKIDF